MCLCLSFLLFSFRVVFADLIFLLERIKKSLWPSFIEHKHILVMAFFFCHTIFVIRQLPYHDISALCVLFVPFRETGTTIISRRFGLKITATVLEVFTGHTHASLWMDWAAEDLFVKVVCVFCVNLDKIWLLWTREEINHIPRWTLMIWIPICRVLETRGVGEGI